MPDWIIVERSQQEHEEDGIRFKAFPCTGLNPEVIKDIAYDPDVDMGYWWADNAKDGK